MPRMTREEFLAWITGRLPGYRGGAPPLYVQQPFDVATCHCGDSACKGWRIVGRPATTADGGATAVMYGEER